MRKYAVLLTALCTLFISCQQELSFDPGTNNPQQPVNTNDSILLSQLIYLDTTVASPNDTVSLDIYTYNSRKLVNYIESYSYNGGPRRLALKKFFFYNSTDTVPYKVTHIAYLGNAPITIDTFHFYYQYNAQGIIVYDSLLSVLSPGPGVGTSISRYYTLAPDKVRRNTNYYSPPPNPTPGSYYTDYRYIFSGTNITAQVTQTSPPTNSMPYDSIIVTYDNHPNPIRNAENDHQFTVGYSDGVNAYQNNNFTTFYSKSIDPISYLVDEYRLSFTYQYNANGYPVKAVITDLLGTGTYPLGNKVIYKYTN